MNRRMLYLKLDEGLWERCVCGGLTWLHPTDPVGDCWTVCCMNTGFSVLWCTLSRPIEVTCDA